MGTHEPNNKDLLMLIYSALVSEYGESRLDMISKVVMYRLLNVLYWIPRQSVNRLADQLHVNTITKF